MLEVYDLNMRRVAILENASEVKEGERVNSVGSLKFTLPADDPKNDYCRTMHYVDINGRKYRILSPIRQDGSTDKLTYECEHVIATLCDDVLFGAHVVGNVGFYTPKVIEYILSKQTVVRWVLDSCDFSRQFEYGWENENLLSALFSVPNRFTELYIWQYDTSTFPWKLSLKLVNTGANPQLYLRADKNLLTAEVTPDSTGICTRLYCLGYGEGVNQLTIKDANGGVPYLQSPQEYIDRYGLVTKIFVDRRYETAQSLKERGEALLKELQEPVLSYSCTAAELYELTQDSGDKIEIGGLVLLVFDGYKTYITGKDTDHDTGDVSITIANKTRDVSSTIADLADRQRAEQVYAQGATQLYAQSVQANATPEHGAKLNFFLPEEMKIINKIRAKITFEPFRSYSKATGGGGAATATSSSGGGTTATSSSGGGINITSSAGGGINVSSTSGGGKTVTSTGGGGTTATAAAGGSIYTSTASGGSSTVTAASNKSSTATSSSGGGSTATSSSGGGTTATSSSGGGETVTSNSGGSDTVSSTSGGSIYTSTLSGGSSTATSSSVTLNAANMTVQDNGGVGAQNHNHGITRGKWLLCSTGGLTPSSSVQWCPSGAHKHGSHNHTVSISSHSHTVSVSSHSHNVKIPSHTHTVKTTNHTHTVTIYNHTHTVEIPNHTHTVTIPSHTHEVSIPNHTHTVSVTSHTHTVKLYDHTHDITIPNHTHTVKSSDHTHTITAAPHSHTITIDPHTHSVTIPAHTHEITQGIFEFGCATEGVIKVNGESVETFSGSPRPSTDVDLTEYMLNSNGKIDRGSWQSVEVVPRDLAYVTIDLYVQGFIQSEGGSIY